MVVSKEEDDLSPEVALLGIALLWSCSSSTADWIQCWNPRQRRACSRTFSSVPSPNEPLPHPYGYCRRGRPSKIQHRRHHTFFGAWGGWDTSLHNHSSFVGLETGNASFRTQSPNDGTVVSREIPGTRGRRRRRPNPTRQSHLSCATRLEWHPHLRRSTIHFQQSG
jgi:hypothetical protein